MNERVELPKAREVCPTTTRRLMAGGALMVDVREADEVAQTAFDVPAVALMPLSELERRFAELPRDRQLVVVSREDDRSLKAAYFLMYQGYAQVASMAGGIEKWARNGFPIRGAMPVAAGPAGGCCCAKEPAASGSRDDASGTPDPHFDTRSLSPTAGCGCRHHDDFARRAE